VITWPIICQAFLLARVNNDCLHSSLSHSFFPSQVHARVSNRLTKAWNVISCPRWSMVIVLLCALVLPKSFAFADAPDEKNLAFFEAKIRPVLAEHCYACHNSHNKKEGGLALDYRGAMQAGGDRGTLWETGSADKSLLIKVLRHTEADLRMPRGGPKLNAQVVQDFRQWIEAGAVDPRLEPPSVDQLAKETAWETVRERRKSWWSLQPLATNAPPEISDARWNQHEIDRFLHQARLKQKLETALPADRATLCRRVSYVLTGLPPTTTELQAFVNDDSPQAYEKWVDHLFASPRFGERWARHSMDWFRYAESHGSEGDPQIPFAWRYRDYLIRAWNSDLPYSQFVREHIAGDLLPTPRMNETLGIRESALGIGHFRMVQHGYAPTDALEEETRFIDNQIDVVSKAFLGLTLSCARCHHHKFDALSQDDFYAWYGIFASSRPGTINVDAPENLILHTSELADLKNKLKTKLSERWLSSLKSLEQSLTTHRSNLDSPTWKAALVEAKQQKEMHPLYVWLELESLSDAAFAERLQTLQKHSQENNSRKWISKSSDESLRWNFQQQNVWHAEGADSVKTLSPAGTFALTHDGTQVVRNIYPAGVYSHTFSTKHPGILLSPRISNEYDELWVRVAGGGQAKVRYVVHGYPRSTLLYPQLVLKSETFSWQKLDLRYWKGDAIHLEIGTGDDQPLDPASEQGRSWFGVTDVVWRKSSSGAPSMDSIANLVLKDADTFRSFQNSNELAHGYITTLRDCITAWQQGTMTDAQAEFLSPFVRHGILPNSLAELSNMQQEIQDYRRLESEIPIATRAPGLHEGASFDQPLFERGVHTKPLAPVPRRFLEVFQATPYQPIGSGRLQLANDLSNLKNPLVARVIVNRLWQYVFGRGLVATPDNFGALGETPSHPELLDFLAARFSGAAAADHPTWKVDSMKDLLRHMVLSETFRLAATKPEVNRTLDPANLYLTHFTPRRLEAEAIRDTLLYTSGELQETLFGPSVASPEPRRSIYVQVKRNALDPFLSSFDMPEPTSCWGKRESTNVPAQSLALMNDPFVIERARRWSESILKDQKLTTDEARMRAMLFTALGREPTTTELAQTKTYLHSEVEQITTARVLAESLKSQIATKRSLREQIFAPHRKALQTTANEKQSQPQNAPTPLAQWSFEGNLRDSQGKLSGTLMLNGQPSQELPEGTFQEGALVLNEKQSMQTSPLNQPLAAKTLEAWVKLDALSQRAGGVMTVESLNGAEFDAVVYAEKEPQRWLAGSNFFRRTQNFEGEMETEADQQPVHIAIAYAADGTITAYRNGKMYGKSYSTKEPLRFPTGAAHVLFGLRHSPSTTGRHLQGKIFEARLYDRALSSDEVAASFASFGLFVSDTQVMAKLTDDERKKIDSIDQELKQLQQALGTLGNLGDSEPNPQRRWQDFAQSLFNVKEFIYLK
jgi:Protein of unknown function (DUF1553)/Protein of unknown function (DUF1549)/Concanavalin A-like lectin/glucanases superfamily/Planctomycete cytochrome C